MRIDGQKDGGQDLQKLVESSLAKVGVKVFNAVTSKYLPGLKLNEDMLGTAGKAVFENISSFVTKQVSKRGGEISGLGSKGLPTAALELTAAALKDGLPGVEQAFKTFVGGLIGEPPSGKTGEDAVLDSKLTPNLFKDGKLVGLKSTHALWDLLQRLGLSGAVEKQLPSGLQDLIKKDWDLSQKKDWVELGTQAAKDMLLGWVNERAKQSKSPFFKDLNTAVQSWARAETVEGVQETKAVNGQNGATHTDGVDKSKAQELHGANQSNTQARMNVGSSPAAILLSNMAFGIKAKEPDESIKQTAAFIMGELGVEPGGADFNPKHEVAVKALSKALQPLVDDQLENPDSLDVMKALLTGLQDIAKKRGGVEGDTRAAALKHHINLVQGFINAVDRSGLALEEISPSGASAMNRIMGAAARQLVAASMNKPLSELPGSASLSELEDVGEAILAQIAENGVKKAFSDVVDETENTSEADAPKNNADATESDLNIPLLAAIDPADLPGSAKKIADVLLQFVPPEHQTEEIAAKISGAVSSILETGPKDNLELTDAATDWLINALDLSPGAASELKRPIMELKAKIQDGVAYGAAASEAIKLIESEIQGINESIEQAEAEIKELEANPDDANIKRSEQARDLIKSLGESIAAINSELEGLNTDPEANKDAIAERTGKLEEFKTQLGEQEERLKGFEANPETDTTRLEAAKSRLAALKDSLQTQTAGLEETKGEVAKKTKQAEDARLDSNNLPLNTMSILPAALTNPGEVKKALEAAANGPNGPNGPDDPNKPGDPGWKPKGDPETGEYTIAERRAMECSAILNDPALSIQDKIFLFMLVYASYSDMEREDKLAEFTKLEQKQAEADATRKGIKKDRDAKSHERKDLVGQKDGLEKEIERLEAMPQNRETQRELNQAREKLTEVKAAVTRIDDGISNLDVQLQDVEKESKQVPHAREVIFMEIEKITKFRDQVINMARSLIDEANRLIERIWR